MPFYEYHCDECGRFSQMMPIDRRNENVSCPICNSAGRRLFSAPNLALVRKDIRLARERNERAAHEPRRVKKQYNDIAHQGHSHSHGQAHHDHGHHDNRPWMLGH